MPSAKGGPSSQNEDSNTMDKNISFDKRDMHKTWPFVKGCLMLIGAVIGFCILTYYVFKVVDFNKLFG